MRTSSPAWILPLPTYWSARRPPYAAAVASSWLRLRGLSATHPCRRESDSIMHRYSAYAPSRKPVPPYTSSPGWNLVVFGPVSSMTPEKTNPRIGWRGRVSLIMSRNGICNLAVTRADRIKMSLAVTALARIRMRTSSGLGDGRRTSQTRRTSGGPYRSQTAAFIVGGADTRLTTQLSGGFWAWLSLWTKNHAAPRATMQAPSVFTNVSVRCPSMAAPVFTTVMSTERTIPAVAPCRSFSFMGAWSPGRHTAEQYSWSCADRALLGGGAPSGRPD